MRINGEPITGKGVVDGAAFEGQVSRRIAPLEVFLAFAAPVDARMFRDWLAAEGWDAFARWIDDNDGNYDEFLARAGGPEGD